MLQCSVIEVDVGLHRCSDFIRPVFCTRLSNKQDSYQTSDQRGQWHSKWGCRTRLQSSWNDEHYRHSSPEHFLWFWSP